MIDRPTPEQIAREAAYSNLGRTAAQDIIVEDVAEDVLGELADAGYVIVHPADFPGRFSQDAPHHLAANPPSAWAQGVAYARHAILYGGPW